MRHAALQDRVQRRGQIAGGTQDHAQVALDAERLGRPLPLRNVAEEAHEARPPLVRQASADDVHVDRAPVLVQATEIGDLRQAALRALRERRQILRHVHGRMDRLDTHVQQLGLAVAEHRASGRIRGAHEPPGLDVGNQDAVRRAVVYGLQLLLGAMPHIVGPLCLAASRGHGRWPSFDRRQPFFELRCIAAGNQVVVHTRREPRGQLGRMLLAANNQQQAITWRRNCLVHWLLLAEAGDTVRRRLDRSAITAANGPLRNAAKAASRSVGHDRLVLTPFQRLAPATAGWPNRQGLGAFSWDAPVYEVVEWFSFYPSGIAQAEEGMDDDLCGGEVVPGFRVPLGAVFG